MQIYSCQASALETSVITIESEMTRGFAGVNLIGNVSEVCRNGLERARTALESLEVILPQRRIVISIAPADLKKEGSQFDLAIAISLAFLVKNESSDFDPNDWMFVAELGLAGELRPVKSIISHTLAAVANGLKGIIVCKENLADVECLTRFKLNGMDQFEVKGFSSLRDLFGYIFDGENSTETSESIIYSESETSIGLDDREVMTKESEKTGAIDKVGHDFDDMLLTPDLVLAAKVVATGLHSIFLSGTPGTGKSMFAARLTSIMPKMKETEHLDALRISSACHEKIPNSLLAGRSPFRNPHHQASSAAILGTPNNPGELSLAHGGVLFLDEFPEFRRDIIEALREPLEVGLVQVSRAKQKVTWKSRVCLVTAANNCPCGWYGSQKRKCHCPLPKVANYRRKISGPIMDRIDIHLNLQEFRSQNSDLFLVKNRHLESVTQRMKSEVEKAVNFSKDRNRKFGITFNRDLEVSHIAEASGLKEQEFVSLVDKLLPKSLSRRSLIRVLRIARSIADLSGETQISELHIKKGLQWQADSAAKERGDFESGIY